MLNNPANFARFTFSLFGQEGRFQISMLDGQDVEPLVEEYTSLGCRVTIDQMNRRLIVSCSGF